MSQIDGSANRGENERYAVGAGDNFQLDVLESRTIAEVWMEIGSGAVTSTLKFSLQVLSSSRSPKLEIYPTLKHTLGPPEEHLIGAFGASHPARQVHRPQEIGLEFSVVNVGGERAEDVRLKLIGDFVYHSKLARLSRIPILAGLIIPQLAPAESLHIFRFDAWDLLEYGADGRPERSKQVGFSIIMAYNGPNQGLNRVRRGIGRLWRSCQFETVFRFDPKVHESLDLPSPEVLG